ncbi:hypothetical protein HOK68_00805 [Candidatus Woesearchaeota archaeon]|mgnify:CR=1 FL=1|jgi:protein-tyrosine phosphatase|nr:hypothetical protein [Candidatus Woesearchaeota archaeon]MBT4387296.1 hypothetical protein [Candidatus Woesearchaeota archaeon]MBT4595435.1 hypothetical protein [Candidatus Woesearchaeota archaeon]MBT5741150.1 hypothetical protein [Candidatus Woesearchaeota archaeon]MBT6505300.1 hypothetical protein [Candidatus Woesearchaeota archaeon]
MKILFVCLGNYCRSPIAHAIAKHIFPNWTIDSCALSHCHEGEQMHINSRKILKKHEMFYDVISKHISKVNIKNFDLVLCMDFSNYVKLNGLGIKCEYVTFLKDNSEVEDPYGENVEFYEQTYKKIYNSILELKNYKN